MLIVKTTQFSVRLSFMSTRFIVSLLLMIGLSCGDNAPHPEELFTNACSKFQGLIGSSATNCQPLLAGMCDSSSTANINTQCPPPYNHCCSQTDQGKGSCKTVNTCVVQDASDPSQRTWFATDSIRPGITSNNSDPKDYIYNIMAKGYESLDDWCMSQAQQSTHPSMRNIHSWTALIIAQPDAYQWTSGNILLPAANSLSTAGQTRLGLFQFGIGSEPSFGEGRINIPYRLVNGVQVQSNPRIQDKNGNLLDQTTVYWSGLGGDPNHATSNTIWSTTSSSQCRISSYLQTDGLYCTSSSPAYNGVNYRFNSCLAGPISAFYLYNVSGNKWNDSYQLVDIQKPVPAINCTLSNTSPANAWASFSSKNKPFGSIIQMHGASLSCSNTNLNIDYVAFLRSMDMGSLYADTYGYNNGRYCGTPINATYLVQPQPCSGGKADMEVPSGSPFMDGRCSAATNSIICLSNQQQLL